eukprot:TRINITY_DN64381_c0_g1_i1.p2 TRINITY_DN64381_c0_g1~~TRINITY_DN64381_c0_g1_i1.p2  ORF type:complete len:567 (+),score=84.13 TRINITY_DN64381_c0_g1_i1:141-1703(+)
MLDKHKNGKRLAFVKELTQYFQKKFGTAQQTHNLINETILPLLSKDRITAEVFALYKKQDLNDIEVKIYALHKLPKTTSNVHSQVLPIIKSTPEKRAKSVIRGNGVVKNLDSMYEVLRKDISHYAFKNTRKAASNYLSPIFERQKRSPLGNYMTDCIPSPKPKLSDQWGIISLLKDKEDHKRAELERQKEQQKKYMYCTEIIAQIKHKQKKLREQLEEIRKQDIQLLEENTHTTTKQKEKERESKIRKILDAKKQIFHFGQLKKQKTNEFINEKKKYSDHFSKLGALIKTEDLRLLNTKKEVAQKIQAENKVAAEQHIIKKREDKMQEISKERKDLEYTVQRMKDNEARWKNEFRKKLRKMHLNQSEVLKDFSKTDLISKLKVLDNDATYLEEQEKRDAEWEIHNQNMKLEKQKKRKELVEVLNKLISEKKQIQKQESQADKVQAAIWKNEAKKAEEESLKLRLLKKKHAREYSEDLSQQIYNRIKNETLLTPTELSINKAYLASLLQLEQQHAQEFIIQ